MRHPPDTEIMARLDRLERENRRLKRLGVAALVIAAALGLMAATRPVPDKITAHEFDVVDSAGKVRVAMSISPSKVGMPGLALYDRSGNPVAGLTTMGLSAGGRYSELQISSPHGKSVVTMGVIGGDPSIDISDANGFRMVLGSTFERDSSADSIIMLGNDKKHRVIWRAP